MYFYFSFLFSKFYSLFPFFVFLYLISSHSLGFRSLSVCIYVYKLSVCPSVRSLPAYIRICMSVCLFKPVLQSMYLFVCLFLPLS